MSKSWVDRYSENKKSRQKDRVKPKGKNVKNREVEAEAPDVYWEGPGQIQDQNY